MPFLKWVKNHFVPTTENAYRPHLLKRPWLVFFLALILGTEGFLVANLVARQSDQNFLAAVVPAEVIALTNDERAQQKVGQLTDNSLLDAAAQAKANDMAAKGYFSHNGPDGKTPWAWISGAGYSYQYAGENLAVRFIDSQDVVNAWMASPTHRANIIKPVYTEIGVGVAQGLYEGDPATYVVQYFASPNPAVATTRAASSSSTVASTSAAPARVAQAPTLPGQVEAAAVAPTQSGSFIQSLVRQLIRALSNPEQTSNWILGASAAILIIVLACTFFMHLQVQPTNMLVSGSVVVVFALSFLVLNSLLIGVISPKNKTSPVTATPQVTIDSQAAGVGYALFP